MWIFLQNLLPYLVVPTLDEILFCGAVPGSSNGVAPPLINSFDTWDDQHLSLLPSDYITLHTLLTPLEVHANF